MVKKKKTPILRFGLRPPKSLGRPCVHEGSFPNLSPFMKNVILPHFVSLYVLKLRVLKYSSPNVLGKTEIRRSSRDAATSSYIIAQLV